MLSILLNISKGLFRKILVLCLMTLLISGSLIYFALPVYAATGEELQLIPPEEKPTNEEKIDRAYELSGASGRLEEMKQQISDPNEYFDPTKKANTGTIQEESKSEPGLIQKAKEFVENVTK